MSPLKGTTAWAAVLAHCQRLTHKSDAYYLGNQRSRRAAGKMKSLRFDRRKADFFKRK
jgi:hypothetical protein